ncbi:unnamed protein product, partial [Ranitomeya imitator]
MYYQERLARDRLRVDHWLDYGCFKLLIGDHIKAQECFHEALAANREHLHSLLLCGVIAVILDNNEGAELFFEDATCVAPGSALAWTMLGGTEVRTGRCPHLRIDGPALENVPTSSHSSGKKTPGPSSVVSKSKAGTHRGGSAAPTSPRPRPAASTWRPPSSWRGSMPLSFFPAGAVTRAPEPGRGSQLQYHLMCAQVHLLRKEFDAAHENLREAAQVDHQTLMCGLSPATVQYTSGRKGEARQSYEQRAQPGGRRLRHAPGLPPPGIHLPAGGRGFEKAKTTYHLPPGLQTLAHLPSPGWVSVVPCRLLQAGGAAGGRGRPSTPEANALNNSNAEVWGYLTLVCLKTGRQLEARTGRTPTSPPPPPPHSYTRKVSARVTAPPSMEVIGGPPGGNDAPNLKTVGLCWGGGPVLGWACAVGGLVGLCGGRAAGPVRGGSVGLVGLCGGGRSVGLCWGRAAGGLCGGGQAWACAGGGSVGLRCWVG